MASTDPGRSLSESDESGRKPSKRARTNGDYREKYPNNDSKQEQKVHHRQQQLLEPITTDALERADELAATYRSARPYPHGLITDFCKKGFLEEVLKELKHNSKVKFKETDLFRFYQSIDLGNLKDDSSLAQKMPYLVKLKNAIYSSEYRAFIERITGLEQGTLTDLVDCAANCHSKGCHLLCHDDVIGTRKVSYIIYLTDPDTEWVDSDGGRLELYEAIPEKIQPKLANGKKSEEDDDDCCRYEPGPFPVKTIVPAFNTLAYFVVKPGVSFHSVQEVFCDRPRLSIQGWYHAKESPSQIENATLQRLKSTGKGEDTEGEFKSTNDLKSIKENGKILSEKDEELLKRYLNNVYLGEKSMNDMRTRFEEESSVKLRHFLNEEWASKIKGSFSETDENDGVGKDRPALDYHVGVNDNWKAVGPAHKQRFLEYVPTGEDGIDTKNGASLSSPKANTDTIGEHMDHLRKKLLESAAFGRWLGYITSLGEPTGHRGRVRRFRPGLDYTVAHYGILTTNSVLDATLCFCGGDGEQCTFDEETGDLLGSDDDAIWESGDIGGFECYIAADESGEDEGPDAEYDEEDDTKLLSVSASNNTLSLVYRDPGTIRFVKYVGSGAPSSRWDLAFEYNVPDDAED